MVNMETAETADNDIGAEEDRIREVWNHNLEEEFKNICRVVQVWSRLIVTLKLIVISIQRSTPMLPWTPSSLESLRDPSENLNQQQIISISY